MRLPALLLACLLTACATASSNTEGDSVRFIVVRRAEKTGDTERDPDLGVAGRERAQRLAGLLADRDLAAVYATEFRRTQRTAQPTADAHRIPVNTYEAKAPAVEFTAKLKVAHPHDTVRVVGRSNTVPGIVSVLCGCEAAPMPETEYDRISTVRIDAGGKGESSRTPAEHRLTLESLAHGEAPAATLKLE